MRDQGGMLREYVKWDYELRYGDQLERIVDRALAIAMTPPAGPVYLSLPREALAAPMAGLRLRRRRRCSTRRRARRPRPPASPRPRRSSRAPSGR